jgi:hypothetical protein
MSSPNRTHWLIVLPLLGWAFMVCPCRAKADGAPLDPGFNRPDPSLVHQTTRDILSDPRYSPRMTFWQWLMQKLSGWRGPELAFAGRWGRVLLFVLLIWCILALLAVIGHLIWMLFHLIAGRVGWYRRAVRIPGVGPHAQLTYEAMRRQADDLARQGAYRQAAAAILVAVLCWLQEAGLLCLHESKTNGDYVREFAGPAPVQDEFRRLIYSVEPMTYGGAPCDRADYQHASQMAMRICSDAERQPES